MSIFTGKVVMQKSGEKVIEFLGPHTLANKAEDEKFWTERGYPVYDATLLIENGEASQKRLPPQKKKNMKNETKRLRVVRTSRKKVKRNKQS